MQKTEDLITMVRNLTEKRFQLEKELEDIEGKLIALKNSNSDELNIINNLRAELNKLEIINGTKEVKGPGLKVIISKDSPILYIDIVSIINELWAAGAEAISVNDTRIDYSTVFFYTETENSMFITLNHKPLTFPIIIKAIGNPNTLEKGLTLPGGIIDNLALFRAYPYLEQEEEIIIPPIENELVLLEAELVRK
jgi:uncharacterized protein YlxW (UPF0749 family)